MAKEMGLDLVEVSKQNDTPVCKIIDYEKYLYDKKKNEKKPVKVKIKEIKMRPSTDQADFDRKLKQAKEFLDDKCIVKTMVVFSGREQSHPELGELIIYKFIAELADCAVIDNKPNRDGKRIVVMIKPKKEN